MAAARTSHTATLLQNGQVLIVGGRGNGSNYQLSSAELYDPGTGVFASTGSMATPRTSHAATLLQSGRVLIAGGDDVDSAEIYDPSSGTFASAGALDKPREGSTATLLASGKVLIAGGEYLDCDTPASEPCNLIFFGPAELYYPAAGIFTATGSLNTGRIQHTATLLANGMVLLAGGEEFTVDPETTTVISSVELYDPGTDGFAPATSLIVKRENHTATLLEDGTVLIAGGSGSTPASAELYEPDTGEFVPTGFLATLRESHTATLLPNGQVLIAGGFGETGGFGSSSSPLASAELYDPVSRTFRAPGQVDTGISDGTSDGGIDGGWAGDGASQDASSFQSDASSSDEGCWSCDPAGITCVNSGHTVQVCVSCDSPKKTKYEVDNQDFACAAADDCTSAALAVKNHCGSLLQQ
jgi:hypothetical protein